MNSDSIILKSLIALTTTVIGLVLAQTFTGVQIVQKLLSEIVGNA